MFSRFFINRPIFACVVSIVIVIAGIIARPILPVEQTPDITPPTVVVSASYPGASAEVVADTVGIPIEEQVNGVEDMIYMSSKNSDNGSYELTVTFAVGTDIDMATILVQNRVAIAEPKLPEEVRREGVRVEKRSTNIVLLVSVFSDTNPDTGQPRFDEIKISNFVGQNLKDELGRVPGVGKVQVLGAKDYGMRIWLDPNRLKAHHLTVEEVVAAIREQNVQVAAGQIGAPPNPPGQQFQYTVSTLGRLSDVEQFEDMILKVGNEGRVLRVRDVARVELGAQLYNWNVSLASRPNLDHPRTSVAVAIYQLPGANALQVAEDIQAKMEDLYRGFPEGMNYDIAYDTTRFVKASVAEVQSTLIVAVILVVLTVYVFLHDLRTTLIPALTIPVALIGTFAVMLAIGLSVNTLTLFGLVLAIGIVVDDAIVVVENTMRLIDEEKLPPKEATAKAMGQVTGPVIATTLVLLAVFVPCAMLGGITGRLYQQFALTIATATVFSSINALTLSPALCGILLRPTNPNPGWFAAGFDRFFGRATNGYMRVAGLLARRTMISMVLFLGLVAAMAIGFVRLPKGFLPDEDQGVFIVNVQLPDGATLERSQAVVDQVSALLAETPGVSDAVAVTGFSALDLLVGSNSACFFVVLDPWEERTDPNLHVNALVQRLQSRLSRIQDGMCLAFIPPPISGLGSAGGFQLQLQDRGGAGVNELEAAGNMLVVEGNADPLLTRLNSNFRANVPQLFLDVDRVKAKKMGVGLTSIFGTLQAYLGSAYVNDFNLAGRVYKVQIQADSQFRSRVEDIQRLDVRNANGDMVPLGTLLTVNETAGPKTVFRFNGYPSATITGQAGPGYSSGQAIEAVEAMTERLPPAMGYEWSGVTREQIEAGAQVFFIFAMAVVFVYLFLAAQYESWAIPWAVLLSVPFAILGAVAATAVRAFDNNIYTQIGLVLLIGLASKSAILIVEFAKQRHAEGLSIVEAALEAAHLRFRAILMTAFSFILGVIPLVIASGAGAASRRALGTAVFGGTLAATLLGVFLIPVLFIVIQRTSEWVRRGGKG